MKIGYSTMSFTKTFFVPSFNVATVTATPSWTVLVISMPLMISFFETGFTNARASRLHAIVASIRRTCFLGYHIWTHWTLAMFANLVSPIKGVQLSYRIHFEDLCSKIVCPIRYFWSNAQSEFSKFVHLLKVYSYSGRSLICFETHVWFRQRIIDKIKASF